MIVDKANLFQVRVKFRRFNIDMRGRIRNVFIIRSYCQVLVLAALILSCENVYPDNNLPPLSFISKRHEFCRYKNVVSCDQKSNSNLKTLNQVEVKLSCEQYYQANHCDEIKKSFGAESAIVMSCSPQDLCKDEEDLNVLTCLIDGAKVQFEIPSLALTAGLTLGTMLVGTSSAASMALALPIVVYGAAAESEACNADVEFKKMAIRIHNLSLFEDERPLDIEKQDKDILKMECIDLKKFLQNRLEVMSQKRQEKSQWTVGYQTQNLPPAARALIESLHSNRCYSSHVIREKVCQSIAGLAVGTAIGGAAGLAGKSIGKMVGATNVVGIGKVQDVHLSWNGVPDLILDEPRPLSTGAPRGAYNLAFGSSDPVAIENFGKAPKWDGSIPIPKNVWAQQVVEKRLSSSENRMKFETGSISAQNKKLRRHINDLKLRSRSGVASQNEREMASTVVEYENGDIEVVKMTSNQIGTVTGQDQEKAFANSKIFSRTTPIKRILHIHTHPNPENPQTGGPNFYLSRPATRL
jgi:hypothetical protein